MSEDSTNSLESTESTETTIETNMFDYNAIIDVAGVILKNKPRDFIEKIYHKIENKTILYIRDNIKYIYDKDITNEKIYNNEIYENVFILYDNKNCVGVDFKQPFYMKGLITVNKENTLTEIAQGIFRLRNINIGHTINFYYCYKDETEKYKTTTTTTEETQEIDINDLYKKFSDNEIKIKENLKNKALLQTLKLCQRFINNYNIDYYEEEVYYNTIKYKDKYFDESTFIKDIIIKSDILKKISPIIISSTGKNFVIETEKEKEKALNNPKGEKRKDDEALAYGTYGSKGGQELVYRVKKDGAFGGYKIVKENTDNASRENLLEQRSKKKSDRFCY